MFTVRGSPGVFLSVHNKVAVAPKDVGRIVRTCEPVYIILLTVNFRTASYLVAVFVAVLGSVNVGNFEAVSKVKKMYV